MTIGFQVACAAYITDKPVVGINALEERKEGPTLLKGSVENVVIGRCTLANMYETIS